jgi:hypothetical protein
MNIELKTIRSGIDPEFRWCWVAPTVGFVPDVPGKDGTFLAMPFMLDVYGCDDFSVIHAMKSTDGGQTWTEPAAVENMYIPNEDDTGMLFCDCALGWYEKTQRLLMFGTSLDYLNGKRNHDSLRRNLLFTSYDPVGDKWMDFRVVGLDAERTGRTCAGGAQWVECEDGSILYPLAHGEEGGKFALVTVGRIVLDGGEAKVLEQGQTQRSEVERGLYEPALTQFNGRYYLTMRNDIHGYVTSSDDGFKFRPYENWKFDDDSDLGNYNTYQRWVKVGGKLHLVYTRRGANNENVFRHRAPLFIAEVDPERLRVIRSTEKEITPNRGARTGNPTVFNISDDLAIVSVAEWMQADGKVGKEGVEHCAQYGSDNSIFFARITP